MIDLEGSVRQLRLLLSQLQSDKEALTSRLKLEEQQVSDVAQRLAQRLADVDERERRRREREQSERRETAMRFKPQKYVTYDQDYVSKAKQSKRNKQATGNLINAQEGEETLTPLASRTHY